MNINVTSSAPILEQVKRRPGRPRRADDYTCVSVTISSELIQRVDELARQWGVNRSVAVTRILDAEINNGRIDGPIELENALKTIEDLVSHHVSTSRYA